MDTLAELYPPTDETDEELSFICLDDFKPHFLPDMSFMESLTL